MVDWLVKTAMQTKDDLYYGVCPKDVMEARYPTSNRTYTKLKDIELCGADVNIARISVVKEHLDTWEALIGNRKSPLRQAGSHRLGYALPTSHPSIHIGCAGRTCLAAHRH
jgi:hypothetical protein